MIRVVVKDKGDELFVAETETIAGVISVLDEEDYLYDYCCGKVDILIWDGKTQLEFYPMFRAYCLD